MSGVNRFTATDAEVRNLGVMNLVVGVMEGYDTDTPAGFPTSARDRKLGELTDLIRGLRVTEGEDDTRCSVHQDVVLMGGRER